MNYRNINYRNIKGFKIEQNFKNISQISLSLNNINWENYIEIYDIIP